MEMVPTGWTKELQSELEMVGLALFEHNLLAGGGALIMLRQEAGVDEAISLVSNRLNEWFNNLVELKRQMRSQEIHS